MLGVHRKLRLAQAAQGRSNRKFGKPGDDQRTDILDSGPVRCFVQGSVKRIYLALSGNNGQNQSGRLLFRMHSVHAPARRDTQVSALDRPSDRIAAVPPQRALPASGHSPL